MRRVGLSAEVAGTLLTSSLPEASWSLAPPGTETPDPPSTRSLWWLVGCGQHGVEARWTRLASNCRAGFSRVLLGLQPSSACLESQKAGDGCISCVPTERTYFVHLERCLCGAGPGGRAESSGTEGSGREQALGQSRAAGPCPSLHVRGAVRLCGLSCVTSAQAVERPRAGYPPRVGVTALLASSAPPCAGHREGGLGHLGGLRRTALPCGEGRGAPLCGHAAPSYPFRPERTLGPGEHLPSSVLGPVAGLLIKST